MPKKVTLSEELFEKCRKRLKESNYEGVHFSFIKGGVMTPTSISRYFGSYQNFLQTLRVPLCRMKNLFCSEEGDDSLLGSTHFSRKFGELKTTRVTRTKAGRIVNLEDKLFFSKTLLLGSVDLQSYSPVRIEVQEFYKVFKMIRSSIERAKNKSLSHLVSTYDIYEMYDFALPQFCPVLGIPLDYYRARFGRDSASLDKINPSLGYVKGNVRIISYAANAWCSNMTKEEKLLILKDALAGDEEVIIRKKRNTLLRKAINLETTNS